MKQTHISAKKSDEYHCIFVRKPVRITILYSLSRNTTVRVMDNNQHLDVITPNGNNDDEQSGEISEKKYEGYSYIS